MVYAPTHKPKTHARIVSVASKLFRAEGFRATGVDRLMSAAGLTRGGFYAHFRDKSALLLEALETAFDESSDNLFARGHEQLRGEDWVRAAARRYLSPAHRSEAAQGCAVPSLGAEVARAPAPARRVFGRRIAAIIDGMTERLGGGAQARRRAITLLSSWAGGILLSRATLDPKLSEEILAAVRAEAAAPDRTRGRRRAGARR